jgi:hypothetical protein
MQFKSTFFIFTCAMASGIMASPLAARGSSDYVEIYRENGTTGGYLVYYGPTSGTKERRWESAKIEERDTSCPTQSLWCAGMGGKHQARNDACDNLVTELNGDATVVIPANPRQVCYLSSSDSDAYCCVSWSKAVSGLTKGDLATPALTSKQNAPLFLSLTIPSGNSELSYGVFQRHLYNLGHSHPQRGHGTNFLVVQTQCTTNGIWGTVENIVLEGTCLDVCMSNTGTGCK